MNTSKGLSAFAVVLSILCFLAVAVIGVRMPGNDIVVPLAIVFGALNGWALSRLVSFQSDGLCLGLALGGLTFAAGSIIVGFTTGPFSLVPGGVFILALEYAWSARYRAGVRALGRHERARLSGRD